MSPGPDVQRIAAWLIRAACRRLPEEMREERYLEWYAELHAILADQSVRPGLPRATLALRYSAGIWWASGRLGTPRGGASRAKAPAWHDGAIRVRPANLALRATVGVITWLVVVFVSVGLARALPSQHRWPLILGLVLLVSFAAGCLTDIARADKVRYLPKWAWALICLTQIPGGGIAYLSLGRIGRARHAPPGPA